MNRHVVFAIASTAALLTACQQPATQALSAGAAQASRVAMLHEAVNNAARTPANAARDRYRHPVETLDFFEVDPNDVVVELWPGGGWYTEILAPYLAAGGG